MARMRVPDNALHRGVQDDDRALVLGLLVVGDVGLVEVVLPCRIVGHPAPLRRSPRAGQL